MNTMQMPIFEEEEEKDSENPMNSQGSTNPKYETVSCQSTPLKVQHVVPPLVSAQVQEPTKQPAEGYLDCLGDNM